MPAARRSPAVGFARSRLARVSPGDPLRVREDATLGAPRPLTDDPA
jgi:hypothetical protein